MLKLYIREYYPIINVAVSAELMQLLFSDILPMSNVCEGLPVTFAAHLQLTF